MINTLSNLVIILCLVTKIKGFNVVGTKSKKGTSVSMLNDDVIDDPYADLLNFNKPIDPEELPAVEKESTISSDAPYKIMIPRSKLTAKEAKKGSFEFWDARMGKSLKIPDDDELAKNPWVKEVQYVMEQRKGQAIWSGRSDQDIQRENKKSALTKGANVPPFVEMVVTAVYLEKTHTMKELRKEDEFSVVEYRKWMVEQKTKQKKDPLPALKAQLSNTWLSRHPKAGGMMNIGRNSGNVYYKPPALVVLDEVKNVFTDKSLLSEKDSPAGKKGASSSIGTSSSTSSPLFTPSVVNWEKSSVELLTSPTNPSAPQIPSKSSATGGPSQEEVFKVDEMDMFVPNNCPSEFFVVL